MVKRRRGLIAAGTILAALAGAVSVGAVIPGSGLPALRQQGEYRVVIPGLAADSAPGSQQPATPTTVTATATLTGTATTSPTATTTATAPPLAAPIAFDDSYNTPEDTILVVTAPGVLSNDSGNPAPGAALETGPQHGDLLLNANGSFSYSPDPNFSGQDVFVYRATNGVAPVSTAEVTINVQAVDDPPVAVADAATVAEDAPATTVLVLSNDTDMDGGPRSIASATQPLNGTVLIAGNGLSLTYQPDANYCNNPPGTTLDTFTYTLNGGSTATVAVTVNCVEDFPVAVDDTATVVEDSAATPIPVLANDLDGDGAPKTIASATDPASGTVLVAGDGLSLTYVPDPDYCNQPPGTNPDTFTYTLAPGGSTATVSVTVTCVDDLPTAVDDAATVSEDSAATAVPVLANDTDIDGGPMTIASATDPANGTVVVAGDSLSLTYQPDANYCGPDTFDYSLNGGSSATVSVTVECVNDPAIIATSAGDLAYTEGDPATLVDDGLTVTDVDDTDLDGATVRLSAGFEAGDELLFTDQNGITGSYNAGTGVLTLTGTSSVANYQAALRSVQYRHTGDNPAASKTVEFRADDGEGLGPAATRDIDVTGVDDAPVAVDDTTTLVEDAAASAINVLANDTDPDGGPMIIDSVSQPTNGTVVITGGGTGLTYQANVNYCNEPPGTTLDTFTYTLNGGSTATVTVTVTCVDDPPVALDDPVTILLDGGAQTIDVLANDADVDGGPMIIESVTQPANGAVVITSAGADLTYEPNTGYCNDGDPLDTFTYTLNGSSTATVSVSIQCDLPPTAVDDLPTVEEDAAATAIDVLANDTDTDGGPKVIASATQPANGTVVLTGGSAGAHTGLTYVPDPDYCNDPPGATLDTFTYALNGDSTATVSVTVTCVDDAPVAVADAVTVNEDSGANAMDVLANDTDIDAGPKSVQSVTQPANGAVAITGGGTGLTYEPDADYCNDGDPLDTFTYTLNGGSLATVSVTVTCVPDDPTAVADSPTVLEDATATTIDVLTNDTDPDGGPKTIESVTQPTNGTVAITNGGADLTYAPNPNYCNTPPGSALDTFTYALNGGSIGTVSVTVTCVNDAPSFTKGGDQSVAEDAGAQSVPGWATGISAGPNEGGQVLTFLVTDNSNPGLFSAGPAVAADGTLTYTPAANQHGVATITLKITDDGGTDNGGVNESATQTFTITVTAVNDAPTAAAQTFNAQANMQIIGLSGLLTGASDAADTADLDSGYVPTFTVGTITATAGEGTVSNINTAAGTFDYDPPAGFSGDVTLDYTVCDAGEGAPGPQCSAAASITITVAGPVIWFVDDSAAAGGTGTLASPFNTLAAADAVDAPDHRIFLYSGTYATGIVLNTGEWLFGQAATVGGGTFDTQMGITPPTGTIARPTLGGSAVTVQSTVTLNTNALLKGLTFSTGGATALNDPAGAISGVNVSETSVTTSTGTGVLLSSAVGSFSFTGLTTTGGTGANLTGVNAGATFTFASVTVSSGANPGIAATGGGTLTVLGAANTITATTGTALNVSNTTIGASGLTFRSISANSAVNGIVLNTTGTTAGLTVTGDGAAANNGSGGTIQNTTGVSVSLVSTRDVSLSHMNITGAGDDAIRGHGVTNFALNRSNLTNNGNATAENGIQFGEPSGSVAGLLGVATITNTAVSGSAGNNVHIRNTAGTLTSLTVSNSSFNNLNDVTGANSFLFEASGTAVVTAASITGSTFANNSPQRALEVQSHDSGSISDFVVSGNTFTDNGIHASFTQDASSNIEFSFLNNGTALAPITGSGLQAVNVFSSSQSTGGTVVGTIQGNFFGVTQAGAISAVIQGQTDATLLIDNNIVEQTNGDSRAIAVAFRGPASPLADTLGPNTVISDVTITNNTVTPGPAPSGFPLATIIVEADNQTGADNKAPTVRADIRGNTVPTTPIFDFLDAHIIFYEYDAANGHGIGLLVDNPAGPAGQTATQQLQSTNTGTSGAVGVDLIAGPITTP